MAPSFSVAELHGIMSDIAPQALAEAAYSFSPLMDIIPKVPLSDAQGPRWQTRQARNSSPASFAVGGPLPAPSASDFEPASLTLANYAASVSFADRQFKQVAWGTPLGQMQVTNIIQDQLNDARISLAATMHTDLISGTGGNAFVGLHSTSGPIDTTGTYAGINRATYSNWAPYENTTGGAISVALLNEAWGNARHVVGLNPGNWIMLMDYQQQNNLRELTTGAISSESNVTGVSAQKILGWTDVFYQGVPCIAVNGYTAGRIDAINLNDLAIEVLGNPMMPFDVLAPEVSGDTTLFKIVAYAQLRLRDPRHSSFFLSGLSN